MNNKAYFSNIRSEIISILKSAEEEVLIAMAWFTNRELLNEVIQCLQRGVKVSLILLDDIINHCDFGADFNLFIAEKNSNFYLYPPSLNFMHHKFCVVDGKVLVSGSYNWTNYAESRNLENIIVTDDSSLIEDYIKCFNKMKENLEQVDTFEIVSQTSIPDRDFCWRMYDIAHEVYAVSASEGKKYTSDFEKRLTKLDTPESIKSNINVKTNLASKSQENQSNVTVKDVNDFKYPVSRFNIGFKAKTLTDLAGKDRLKVMINKGQALPFTVTCDAKSAHSGEEESMISSCEFYYGETTDIDKCTKLGQTLTLDGLPKLDTGYVKFKILMTLDEFGKLSIKFVCTNTQKGVEGEQIMAEFVEYLNS